MGVEIREVGSMAKITMRGTVVEDPPIARFLSAIGTLWKPGRLFGVPPKKTHPLPA
jgi:hypothetical protein